MIGHPIFGGYVITGLLGEGGMGAVYVAENATLGKKLAVKLLHPQLSHNQQVVQRFVSEARAASAISHPNIIEVIDAAQLPDGRWYIVLEFLDGQSLEAYVNAHGALPIDTALEVLVQSCAGLAAAHGRPEGAIIHRDLKPENLFVTSRPGIQTFIKVLDFGIAKLNDEILAGGMKTGSHMVMGTPGYMSHEQAKGSANVDHRTDIYALGVIAYRILTGRLPYAATSIGSLVAAQLQQGPPDPHQLRADLPAGWVQTIRAAMSNEPDERPQTVLDFAMRLVEATPNGRAIATAVAPGLMQQAANLGATVRVRAPAKGQPPAMPEGGTVKQPTTLGLAASEVPSQASADPGRKSSRLPIALGVVAVLAAGGVGIGFAVKGGEPGVAEEQVSAAPATETPPAPAPAPPTPARVDVPIETTPPGAFVKIGNLRYGPTPTTISLTTGETVQLRIEADGYSAFVTDVDVTERPEPVNVALTKLASAVADTDEPVASREKPREKKPRKSRRERAKSKTEPAVDEPVKKPEPSKVKKPKGFDPDAPAG